MPYELKFKGEKLQVKLVGDDAHPKDIKALLDTIHRVDKHLSEPKLRERVVKQLKQEIMAEVDGEEVVANWWELPQDILKSNEAARFIAMEADLNTAMHYEKIPFSLALVINDQGKEYAFDREELKKSLSKINLAEHSKIANSALVRLKANVKKHVKDEIEDYVKSALQLERVQFAYDRKKYGDRASLELVFFGDFPDHSA